MFPTRLSKKAEIYEACRSCYYVKNYLYLKISAMVFDSLSRLKLVSTPRYSDKLTLP